MASEFIPALDVGGTHIAGALVARSGEIRGKVLSVPSPSGESKEAIIAGLAELLERVSAYGPGKEVRAAGISMPAPFDYERGVSLMKHKFQAIYEVNLKTPLEERLGIPVYFINDADAFALGASLRVRPEAKRLVGITIGTGLGAGFIENGQVLTHDDRIPEGGEIWNLPYGDGIIEDVVSGRRIMAAYAKLTGTERSPQEIERLAGGGDAQARKVYQGMGQALGELLAAAAGRFAPDVVVLGGKVARAAELFAAEAAQAYQHGAGRTIEVVPAGSDDLALYGAAEHAARSVKK